MLFSKFLLDNPLHRIKESREPEPVFKNRECMYVIAKTRMLIMPICALVLKDVRRVEEKLVSQKPEEWVIYLAKYVIELERSW